MMSTEIPKTIIKLFPRDETNRPEEPLSAHLIAETFDDGILFGFDKEASWFLSVLLASKCLLFESIYAVEEISMSICFSFWSLPLQVGFGCD